MGSTRFSPHVFAREAAAFPRAARSLGPDPVADHPPEGVRSPAWFVLGHSMELSLKALVACRTGREPDRTHCLEHLARSALSSQDLRALERSAGRRVVARGLRDLRRRLPARDAVSVAVRDGERREMRQRPFDATGILGLPNAVHGNAASAGSPCRTRYAEAGHMRYPLWREAFAIGELLVDGAAAATDAVARS